MTQTLTIWLFAIFIIISGVLYNIADLKEGKSSLSIIPFGIHISSGSKSYFQFVFPQKINFMGSVFMALLTVAFTFLGIIDWKGFSAMQLIFPAITVMVCGFIIDLIFFMILRSRVNNVTTTIKEKMAQFQPIQNDDIERAILLSCMAFDDIGYAKYFLYNNDLMIVYDTKYVLDKGQKISEHPNFSFAMNTLMNAMPKMEREVKILEWDMIEEVPEDVLDKTGRVSVYA